MGFWDTLGNVAVGVAKIAVANLEPTEAQRSARKVVEYEAKTKVSAP